VGPPEGCPFISLDNKLKVVVRGLQGWSDMIVGNVTSQLFLARELLHQLEIAHDKRGLSSEETWLKNNLKKHTLALASLKRMIARFHSRIGWLHDGDTNTKLFHLHSRHRKWKNSIAKIVADGQILTNHEDKARAVNDFYENLLGTNLNKDHSINLEELGTAVHNLAYLEIPFTEDEVWATVKKLPSDKESGPDGFTGRFYKTC
jgi:hypothetical protein